MLVWLSRLSNEYTQTCFAGGRLRADEAEVLERRISLGSADLNQRLRLIGYSAVKLLRSSPHVLWVIEHHPTIQLYAHWSIDRNLVNLGKELWERQMGDLSQAQVFANAAWSFASYDNVWAESCYAKADALAAGDGDWWYGKAALFELLADAAQDNHWRQRHSSTLLDCLTRAFAVEPSPALQLKLVFPARQAALAAARGSDEHRLLVLADAEAGKLLEQNIDTSAGRRMLHVVRGLVALVRGSDSDAVTELDAAKQLSDGFDEEIALLGREIDAFVKRRQCSANRGG